MISLAFLVALHLQSWPPTSGLDIPMSASVLAWHCTTTEEGTLGERRRSYCAGYVRAVLELDPELNQAGAPCTPSPSEVLDEIARRRNAGLAPSQGETARNYIVQTARDICRASR